MSINSDTGPSRRGMRFADAPETILADLVTAVSKAPDYEAVYRRYVNIFDRVLWQNTADLSIHLHGPYAKLHFLLRQYHADAHTEHLAHDARARFNKVRPDFHAYISEINPHNNYLYDLEALARLIAAIYDIELPQTLVSMFLSPRTPKPKPVITAEKGFLRMIVERVDDNYIYGVADGIDHPIRVAYTHNYSKDSDLSWGYLRHLAKTGSVLNLVRPQVKNGVMIPQLIIYEPDYLVNITDITSCFQPHAYSDLNYLITKFKPEAVSQPILLGNLAGQLLDEEIKSPDQDTPYAQTLVKFFKTNPFGILAVKPDRQFHIDAQNQKANIKRAVADLTKLNVLSRDKVILEPSFFSQILGLQGRVDLIQQDLSLLIEQKSGKADFIPHADPLDPPRPQLPHTVQMLLYLLVVRHNFSGRYEANGGISGFLMYSKYLSPLVGVGGSIPKLIFSAMKMRNEIVARDMTLAQGGGRVLDTINPDDLRLRPIAPKLWDRYTRPQLDAVLGPIHRASALERSYFYTMLGFVAREHMLSKVGSNMRDDHGLASIWLNPVDAKLQSGNIYTAMRLVDPACDHKGVVEDVVLEFDTDVSNCMANFRKGDIVVLYPYARGSEPDPCSEFVIRCSVCDISSRLVTLHLRSPQTDARIFYPADAAADRLWAIEHDFMEASFASQYRGVHSVLSAPKSRRDLLLAQTEPEVDTSVALKGDYGKFNDLALRVKQAKDLYLIIGPPGTGKTSFGLLTTLKEELAEDGSTVMITSYTNRAVDEICSKLVDEGIAFVRLGSALSSDAAYHPYLISEVVEKSPRLDTLRASLSETRVMVGTTTAFCRHLSLFSFKKFSLAIIDEASQILEPQLLPLLTAVHTTGDVAVKKFVMIGDHKQLPAVVQQSQHESEVVQPELREIGLTDCRLSMFERFLRLYRDNPQVTFMLRHQGRMHTLIADFPNSQFYGGLLSTVPLPHQHLSLERALSGESPSIGEIVSACRMAFLSVSPSEADMADSDKINRSEAEVIAGMVVEIYRGLKEDFSAESSIGVIVPYRNQINTVRAAIEARGIPHLADITIDTVERFQGSQRDNIIFGATVKKLYQLQFLTEHTFEEEGMIIDRKLNVAITRARMHFFIVGNAALLHKAPVYDRLIDYAKSVDTFFTAI